MAFCSASDQIYIKKNYCIKFKKKLAICFLVVLFSGRYTSHHFVHAQNEIFSEISLFFVFDFPSRN